MTSGQSVTKTGSSGGTYTASPIGLSINSSTGAITPSSSVVGTYTVTYTYASGSCTGLKATASITINSSLTTPLIGIATPEKCNTLGSVVLNGLPATGIINQSGIATASYPITGSSMTITNLAAGNYTFTTSNGSCTSNATSSVTIDGVKTNKWNGSTWDNGLTTTDQNIVFAADYSKDEDVNGCSCLVIGSKNVVIKSGRTMKIVNEIKINGTLSFEDSASLVQDNNDAVNSGNITYIRNSSSVRKSDYTYWSSPVLNQSLNISSSYASGLFYSYDDFATPENWSKEGSSTIMKIGKGYIIRASLKGSQSEASTYNASFIGEPNNGIKTIAIGPLGTSNLLGNPYPSALDADKFFSANSSVIEGTIYLWTHNTAIQSASNIVIGKSGSGTLAYTSDDYATYNGTGGVAAIIGGIKPTGKIAAGQAFFTTSKATSSSVTFNNNMRIAGLTLVDGTVVNQQFFKKRNSKTDSVIEKNRIWLNLTNSEGAFKQTLIGYLTDATNEYDNRFDGESFDGNDFVDFYSLNQDKKLTIQGRALPFAENDEVPLGYSSTIAGEFTINIDQVDGSLTNQNVFIEDKLTNNTFNLKNGDYTFNTFSGTFNDRFVLRYTNNKTLNVESLKADDGILVLYSSNYKVLIIRNNDVLTTLKSIVLYNLTGQQIGFWEVEANLESNIEIPIKNISKGVYIVKVNSKRGVIDKKIIVN
ncbi:T9SS type A sorting domain-containing protein [Flavobacterium cellulosilyticum]|uniref:T9SS type A sorting domain-containing protein n=2 Tax=Flavobacterium cellulosilyticum TaxID=2541731 RepID=A0A4R5CND7_9FLAO|nr:T9SS type A sorting domain-containing protein [Flavobacterium cellulosilyticum]